MQKTLVIQSHRSPLPYPWVAHCLATVREWCEINGYEYRFIGDELFDTLPGYLLKKTAQEPVIASDLARLLSIKAALKQYARVVWLDADVLVFDPERFVLPEASYAVGREVWVQCDESGKLKVFKKVHNAFLLFQQNNHFLDFYTETAQRLLMQNCGTMSPQFIGPKLLTALHNVAGLHVMERAGMLCPLVIKSVIDGGGGALTRFNNRSPQPIAAANLCISSCERTEITESEMMQLIELLLHMQSNPFAV